MYKQRDGQRSKFNLIVEWVESLPIGTLVRSKDFKEKFSVSNGASRNYTWKLVNVLGLLEEVKGKDGHQFKGPDRGLYQRVPFDLATASIKKKMEEEIATTKEESVSNGNETIAAAKLKAPAKKGVVKLEDYHVHNIEMSLTKEQVEALGLDRFKLNRRGVCLETHKSEIIPTIASELTIPWHIHSLLQTYSSPTMRYNERGKEYIDDVDWQENRSIIMGIYQNGSMTIQVKCTDNDLDAGGIVALNGFLQGIFPLKCGYSWDDLSKFFIVYRIELNKDGTTHAVDRKFDPTTCWTFKDVYGTYARIYRREVMGREGIRTEAIIEPQMPYSRFHGEMLALMQGGVTDYQVNQMFTMMYGKMEELIELLKEKKL